jgi:hypothetical protein
MAGGGGAVSDRDLAGQQFFEGRLLEILLPKDEMLAVLEAYFDESLRPTGIFCVAGFAFAKPQVRKFNKEWQRLFASYGGFCHMTDLHARKKQFEGHRRRRSCASDHRSNKDSQ